MNRLQIAGFDYASDSDAESLKTTPFKQESPTRPRKLTKLGNGIIGLQNNSYHCYMNAVLQCLLPINELRDHFILKEFFEF